MGGSSFTRFTLATHDILGSFVENDNTAYAQSLRGKVRSEKIAMVRYKNLYLTNIEISDRKYLEGLIEFNQLNCHRLAEPVRKIQLLANGSNFHVERTPNANGSPISRHHDFKSQLHSNK